MEATGLDEEVVVVAIEFEWFSFGSVGVSEFEIGLHAKGSLD